MAEELRLNVILLDKELEVNILKPSSKYL